MKKTVSVRLSSDDLGFLAGAINEALEAAKNESKFKTLTGESYERANEIHAHLGSVLHNFEQRPPTVIDSRDGVNKIQLRIALDDLRFLCAAVGIALAQVEGWELQTRTGATPEEARALLAYFQMSLKEAGGEA
jgi:hypothetical protein